MAPLEPPEPRINIKPLRELCMETILTCGFYSAKVVVTYKEQTVADLCDFTIEQQKEIFPIRSADPLS
jgi:hypothetical protein